jgi:hypothetical protein
MSETAQNAEPVRMTAQEFVSCMAVMLGAAKVKERKPKQPRYIELQRKPIEGKFRWIVGRDLEGNVKRIKAPVLAITLTKVSRGKQYPHSSKRQQRRYAEQEGRRLLKLVRMRLLKARGRCRSGEPTPAPPAEGGVVQGCAVTCCSTAPPLHPLL